MKTYSSTEISKYFGIKYTLLNFLCVSGVVIPYVEATGRGSSRKFNVTNMVEVQLYKYLYFLPIRMIVKIVQNIRKINLKDIELLLVHPKENFEFEVQSIKDEPIDLKLIIGDYTSIIIIPYGPMVKDFKKIMEN